MKRIILSIVLLSSILVSSRAADQWTYANNETLYQKMLAYLDSAQQPIVGEPVYFMLQQFKLEVQAAHVSDKYAWLGQTQRFCNMLEAAFPPAMEHNSVLAEDHYQLVRRTIVMLRDYPMHEHSIAHADDAGGAAPPAEQVAVFTATNKQWLAVKKQAFLEFLQTPRPTDGSIQIVKLYSSGFVFRTANVCVGLDINIAEGTYTADGRSELAQCLDALFITHPHGDHYDIPLMTEMLKAGRPVVMTNDIPKDAPSEHKVIWDKDVLSPQQIIAGVSAQAGMSAQGDVPCLLYLIDVEGWNIAATGDNSIVEREEFYHGRPVPDIVVAPIFEGIGALNKHLHEGTNDEGVTPVYLTAHENEWHHTINGRVSYKYLYSNTYASMDDNSTFTVVMDNGDHITLSK